MKTLRLAWEGWQIAVKSLLAHRMRTLLTMLGVAIGIFAITIIFTLVNSLDRSFEQSVDRLGNTVMVVHHFPWSNESMADWQQYVRRPRVAHREYEALRRDLKYIDAVAFEANLGTQTVKFKNRAVTSVMLKAVSEDYMYLNALDFDEGRPFSPMEVESGRPVVVIGSEVAKQLFEDEFPVGKQLRLMGKKLKVVGVIRSSGMNLFGNNPDATLYLPYGLATRLFDFNKDRVRDKSIAVKVSSVGKMGVVEDEINGIMRRTRGLRPDEESNFAVNRPEMLLNVFGSATRYLQIGGVIISLFSIVVGGFGIGNIMFTTVKERTFEIGLEKALGATRWFVMYQFLLESVLLCIVGGMLGLALNGLVTFAIQQVLASMGNDFQVVVSSANIITGIILSATIGLVSGLIPAAHAARLDPVESMRR
jgi:putative ABC transport system permease protein